MAASRSNPLAAASRPRPDAIVGWLLAAWGLLNLLQAAFTGLANDEAYYLYYSRHLAWGYFDHPPMVALLVRLTSWMGGALGLRLGCTLLQPAYLYLFWRVIRPPDASRRDAMLYILLCFAQPLLQLYGFMALPDAPLMMTTVLTLWAYKRLCARQDLPNATLMGVCIALLGYSKYQGALVVAALMVANPRLLRRWHLWYAATLGLLLMLPHLWWQQQHDWVSLRYHLVGRNADSYRLSFTLEYLALLLCIFNPLFLWHYLQAILRRPSADASSNPSPDRMLRRGLWAVAIVFVLFFLPSTRHGHVQPQWLLPVVLPCVALLFDSFRAANYVRVASLVSLGLFLAVRVVAALDPTMLRGELWHQREQYEAIAQLADGRPIIFGHTYTAPCKYTFYTGGEAYCSPFYFNRNSQWQYDTADRALYGREVLVGNFTNRQCASLPLAMGGGYRAFHYCEIPSYLPTRELEARLPIALDTTLAVGDTLDLDLAIHNPYSFPVASSDAQPVRLLLYMAQPPRRYASSSMLLPDTLPPRSLTLLHGRFPLSDQLIEGESRIGLSIAPVQYIGSRNAIERPLCVELHGDSIRLQLGHR